MHRFLVSCVVAATLAAVPRSQPATWIVDAANGAGTHFTDLAAAFVSSQVRDGDHLLVRPGTYAPAATAKALRVLGSPTATISTDQDHAAPATALAFRNVASRAPIVLKNLTIRGWSLHVALELTALTGAVHCENLQVEAVTYVYGPSRAAILIDRCPLVTLQNVATRGSVELTNVAVAVLH